MPGELPAIAALSDDWLCWIAENRLRGVPDEQLVASLVAEGVEDALARACLAEVATHPLYQGALRFAEVTRRVLYQSGLERTLAGMASRPWAIERKAGLSPEAFFDSYYATNRPVILTDLQDGWPARTRWSPADLKARFGDVTVAVTTGRDADPDYLAHQEELVSEMPLGQYADMVAAAGTTNDFYMVAINRNLERPALAGLIDDVKPLPPYLQPELIEASHYLWMGPAGTLTPLHHDQANLLFCQVQGRKRFYLISPREAAPLLHSEGLLCRFDCERPDYDRFPEFRDVPVTEVVLAPGEALFLPVGWWHQVRALDLSFSVTFSEFTKPNEFMGAMSTLVSSPIAY